MNKAKLSKWRTRLRQLAQERSQCERIAMQSSPMVAASFLERRFRPQQKQPYCYLSASIEGRSRHRYVPLKEARTWRSRAARWQQFSVAIAKWVRLNRECEALLRAMGRERCVPLPKGRQPSHTSRRKRRKN